MTESTYMTTFADYLDDRARTDGLSEADVKRIEELVATDALAGGKIYPSQRLWNGVAESAVNLALTALAHEKKVAAIPEPEKPDAKARRLAFKAAFKTDPRPATQVAAHQLLRAQGMTPKEAEAELTRVGLLYGSPVGTMRKGSTPKEFKRPRDPLADDGGKGDKRAKKVDVPGSKNPWGSAPGAWSITQQGHLIRTLGIEKATAIAAAVGCKIGDTRPNPKFSK